MSDDPKRDQISQGRQAAVLEEPLKIAGERVKDALGRHLLQCKAEELLITRNSILLVDKIVLALQNVINDGKMAERELGDIAEGRHKLYSIV